MRALTGGTAAVLLAAMLLSACAPRPASPLSAHDRAQFERDLADCVERGRAEAKSTWPSDNWGFSFIGFWPADVALIGASLLYGSGYWVVKHEQSARDLTAACLEARNYTIEGR